MVLFIKVLAIAITVYGCLIIFRPRMISNFTEFLKKRNNVLMVMTIKIVLGILMMIAARYCSITWVVLFWGALNTFTGVAGLLIKRDVFIKWLDWVETRPAKQVYLIGVGALFIGVTLILAA
ncbi:MAG: hypothetical protein GF409_08805 [Candidatus Omnitrophica bacterium]|nr:hypothetical protein [Candidatus Omnitrophota bacterium]